MALFEYQAVTSAGRLMTGTLEAANREQATEQLGQMQLTVNELEKSPSKLPRTALGRSEFLLFNEQLAAITEAGIPLERGLRQLAQEAASRSMRRVILAVADRLEAGEEIEAAFGAVRGPFPPLYRQILRAGVQTGRLSEMLASLNRHLASVHQTRRILFEAMCYPLVVLALAMTIMTGLFVFVIPTFVGIYDDFGVDLPVVTRWVMQLARHPWWPVIGIGLVVGVAALGVFVLGRWPAGRRVREGIHFRIPLFGRLHRSSLLTRLADSLAILIASGADLPTGLRVAAGSTGSETLMHEAELVASGLENGASIVEAGRFGRVISRLFVYSIQLGIQRNELGDNLYGLAEMYRQQVRSHQGRLEAGLLPAIIVVVGGIIAFCVASLFLPMVTMMQSLQS